GGREQQHRGKTYITPGANGGSAVYFAGDRLFVIADPPALRSFFEHVPPPGKGPLAESLQLAAQKHSLVAGLRVPEQLQQLLRQGPANPAAEFLRPLIEIQSGTAAVDVTTEARLKVSLVLPDEATAKQAAEALESGLNLVKTQL